MNRIHAVSESAHPAKASHDQPRPERAARAPVLIGPALPNIPWQERPVGYAGVVWRDVMNPIIPRDPFPTANSVFNNAVGPFNGKIAGVFPCDETRPQMQFHPRFNHDRVPWDIRTPRIPLTPPHPPALDNALCSTPAAKVMAKRLELLPERREVVHLAV